jgi:hypothetical protein
MTGTLCGRLDRLLKAAGNDNGPCIAWLNLGETTEQATARWRADLPGKDPEMELMFITLEQHSSNADNKNSHRPETEVGCEGGNGRRSALLSIHP